MSKKINLEPKDNIKISLGFFLNEYEDAICVIDNYPTDYIIPQVGDEINLQDFGDFDFDYFVVKNIHYCIPNPKKKKKVFWIEIIVEGRFF